jgi:secreted trypsin-like serine protease
MVTAHWNGSLERDELRHDPCCRASIVDLVGFRPAPASASRKPDPSDLAPRNAPVSRPPPIARSIMSPFDRTLRRVSALALLAATGCTISTEAPSDGALERAENSIIGGQEASPGEWPWQALILQEDEEDGELVQKMHCGAVVLNRNWVLTAAHCVFNVLTPLDPATLTVVAGDHQLDASIGNEQVRGIAQVVIHPNYGSAYRDESGSVHSASYFNDVALIRLDQPLTLNQRVQPIALSNQYLPAGTQVFATGWGLMDPDSDGPANVLQELSTAVVDPALCANVMRDDIEQDLGGDSPIDVNGAHICIGTPAPNPKTACKGDSGGPLVTRDAAGNWSLAGITSWGSLGCDLYGVYGHVRAQKPWIESVINGGSVESCSGRTIPGAGRWFIVSGALGFPGIEPNTGACATPPRNPGHDFLYAHYFTSLGGDVGHWQARGANTLVTSDAENFRIHIEVPSATTPAAAENRVYHVNWEETDLSLTRADLCTGITGSTGFRQYNENGIYIDVSMANYCPFSPTAAIFTSLVANSPIFATTGVTSIYPLANGFRIYLRKAGITPAFAVQRGLKIAWQAVPYGTNNSEACVGRTSPTNTNWIKDGNSLYVDVNTSTCGETRTPTYLTSLGGTSRHWATTGVTSIYSPTATGFRVYVETTETVATAKSNQWHVNWKVLRN